MSDISVIFSSRTGNTKKVANAIAGELGVKATDVKTSPPIDGNKIIFLGSGTYRGKPGEDMLKFIEANDLKGRRVAIFYTSANPHGNEGSINTFTEAVKGKGASVIGTYHCAGRLLFIVSFGRPNKADLENARKFAKDMMKQS